MNDETIVAVYDTPAHAQLAAADLKQAGIPEGTITVYGGTMQGGGIQGDGAPGNATNAGGPSVVGFWTSLFGGEPDHDTALYDRSVAGGSTVVAVKVTAAEAAGVLDILAEHHPIDLEERAASYGLARSSAATATQSTTGSIPQSSARSGMEPAPAAMPAMPQTASGANAIQPGTSQPGTIQSGATRSGGSVAHQAETLQLAEETISVGKRLVDKGTTRIRRFVVETPVEQQVTLREETVTLERHPVADGRPSTDADFTDRTIEMTETAEEAVVAKQARIVEEVSLRRQATERVETVRDTVRREDVEIEKTPKA